MVNNLTLVYIVLLKRNNSGPPRTTQRYNPNYTTAASFHVRQNLIFLTNFRFLDMSLIIQWCRFYSCTRPHTWEIPSL